MTVPLSPIFGGNFVRVTRLPAVCATPLFRGCGCPIGRPMPDLNFTSAWDYDLPSEQIAVAPTERRRDARMLVVGDGTDTAGPDRLRDARVSEFTEWLRPGDVLVVNDARVTPARVYARRQSGGRVEMLVVGTPEEGVWDPAAREAQVMLRSNRSLCEGEALTTDSGDMVTFAGRNGAHACVRAEEPILDLIGRAGVAPLPPYILKQRSARGTVASDEDDRLRYQTVFADREGAVAAPTAGLHFDEVLLGAIRDLGVTVAPVTLFVGAGTFKPVSTERLSEHPMHREYYDVPATTATTIREAVAAGSRVVAVGTTVVRTLEAAMAEGQLRTGPGSTELFIRPGYSFQVVDALLTNFHLPRSTLLALVSAFAGYDTTMAAYRHAVASGYRFYSYGDAMFIPHRYA